MKKESKISRKPLTLSKETVKCMMPVQSNIRAGAVPVGTGGSVGCAGASHHMICQPQ